ncbi:MAG: monovalent cation/H(+) antiporter subunit G [Planctomycetota bacterium]|nr:monovalent cation/H(+) antiporter subunit G [Planctomycetota bacterium]
MSALEIVGTVFIALGGFVMFMGAVGVVRFPDFYTRLHAAGKGDTLGQALVLLGLIVITGVSNDGLKLVLIAFFIFILNSTSTHALARAAWLAGLKPWTPADSATPQFEGQMSEVDRRDAFMPLLAGEDKAALEASTTGIDVDLDGKVEDDA